MAKLSLKVRAERARAKLESMGVKFAHDSWAEGENSAFAISGEHGIQGTEEKPLIVDYWNESGWTDGFGVDKEIEKVLKHYELISEWVNAGVLGVYDNRWS